MTTQKKKRIYNPVTGKHYEVRQHSSKYGESGEIKGLWSSNMDIDFDKVFKTIEKAKKQDEIDAKKEENIKNLVKKAKGRRG